MIRITAPQAGNLGSSPNRGIIFRGKATGDFAVIEMLSKAGVKIGDTITITTEKGNHRAEYQCAEVLGLDEHGTLAIKHHITKDATKGKGPWMGGEVIDTIDHIKAHEIVSVVKLVEV